MIDIRQAMKEDSTDIARLFLASSDGLAEYIWSKVAEPGETVIETGARRYAREGVAFSYENCLIAEQDGAAVGMAHSFHMEEDPDAEPESDPVLKPYSELEDFGSLYLSGVAVFEQHRNAGIGMALMGAVNQRARDISLPRVSLICFERNEGAIGLYQRLGFRELDRRAVVPHSTLHYHDGDAVLFARESYSPEP
jgi:GNAT superfamily N-acetyltransferase